jgi:hypothetical protein
LHALRVTVVMQPPQSAPCDNAGERLDAALSATGGLTTAC